IENRIGDDGMKAAFAGHGSDAGTQRLSGGELFRAVGAGEDVLFDPVLFGSGEVARPVVDHIGERERFGTTCAAHSVVPPCRPTHLRIRASARCRVTRTTVAVTLSSSAISGALFSA